MTSLIPNNKTFILILLAFFGLLLMPSQSASQSVDSVLVEIIQSDYRYNNGPNNIYFNCGTVLWGTFPDIAPSGSYTLVSTNPDDAFWLDPAQGNYFAEPNPDLKVNFSPDQKAVFIGSTGAQAGGTFSPACADYAANYAGWKGEFGTWYATFTIDDGTPVALFEWEQTQQTTIHFDGSFASEQSHEWQDNKRIPVASYSWDLGNGQSESGPVVNYAYPEAGNYTVTLTVTDDDGGMDSYSRQITVRGAVLSYALSTPAATYTEGDEVTFTVTVTNIGQGDASEVRVPKTVGFQHEYPDEDDTPYVAPSRVAAVLDGDDAEIISTIPAGNSVTVEAKYVIETAARYWAEVHQIAVVADLKTVLVGEVTGLDEFGEAAATIDECKAGGCAVDLTVQPLVTSLIALNLEKVFFSTEFEADISITNNGDQPLTNVTVHSPITPYYKIEYPSFIEEDRGSPPMFEIVSAADPATFANIDPGTTVHTKIQLRVKDLAKWTLLSDGSQQLVSATLNMVSNQVRGLYDNSQWLYAGCRSGRCDAELEVSADVVDLEIVSRTVQGRVSEISTGLEPGATFEDISHVRMMPDPSGQQMPMCRTGCVDIEAVVTDPDNNPVEGVAVDLWVGPFPETKDVKGGRFLCERVFLNEEMMCVDEPEVLTVQTDEEGIARAWYALPGVIEPKEFTVNARLELSPTLVVEADTLLKALPNLVFDKTVNPSKFTMQAGQVLYNTASGLKAISVGEYCTKVADWVFNKTKNQIEYTQLQYDFAKAGFGSVVTVVCDAGIVAVGLAGPVGAAIAILGAAVPGLASKVADLSVFTWYSTVYGFTYKSIHLVEITPNVGVPPLWFAGDFVDFANKSIALAPINVKLGPKRIKIHELSGMTKWPLAENIPQVAYYLPTNNIYDWEYIHLSFDGPEGKVEQLASYGYDTEWLIDNPGTLVDLINFGDVTIDLAESIVSLGDFIILGKDGPFAELLQVVGVQENTTTSDFPGKTSTVATTVQLSSPVKYEHGSNVPMEIVGPGEVTFPPPPIMRPIDHVRPDTLVWAPNPTGQAMSFDIQVARDSLFSDMVLDLDSVDYNNYAFPEGMIEIGGTYYWRTRSTNLVGVGEWSNTQAFSPTTAVSNETESSAPLPDRYAVDAFYPNPSSSSTTVELQLPEAANVSMVLYDMLGRQINKVIVEKTFSAGSHAIHIDVARLPAGPYFARVTIGGQTYTEMVTVVR